ncbi:hypothetical protein [Lentzea sp. CC55]|uniref:hypothetical protein n=1 Tax=Lentzea sp. CC55 TaxID=2884909 RepID=UPI001F336BB5|nr:hypothetical protein [Lentzea sp. CC55]MCG8926629.1 hypothetical protein [Lentzea sp. CC55]
MPYVVTNVNGFTVSKDDLIDNFRGEPGVFVGVTRGVEHNGTAKVSVRDLNGRETESYADVWRLRVRTVSEWVLAQDLSAISNENVRDIMRLMDDGADHWMDPLDLWEASEDPERTAFTVLDRVSGRNVHLHHDEIRRAFLVFADPDQQMGHDRSAHYFQKAWEHRDADGIQSQYLDTVSGDLIAQFAFFGEIKY